MKTNLNERQSTARVSQTDIRTLIDADPMSVTNLNKRLAELINQFGYMSSMATSAKIVEQIGFVTYKVRCYHNANARIAINFAVIAPQFWLLDWFIENNLEPVIFAKTTFVGYDTWGEEIGSESDDKIESGSCALSYSKEGWVDLQRYIHWEWLHTLADDKRTLLFDGACIKSANPDLLSNLIEEIEKCYMMLKLSGTEPDFDYLADDGDALVVFPTPRIDGYITNSTFSEIFDSD